MGALGLLAILMGASSGIGGVMMGLSFVVIGAGAWAALTGRTWLGRVGRKAGGVMAGVGFGLLLTGAVVGAATAPVPTEAREEPTITATPVASSKETTTPAPAVVVEAEASPSPSPSSSPSPSPTPTAPAPVEPAVVESEPTTALAALALLEVRPRDPKTGYDRDLFGYRAVDLDRNGCDTRVPRQGVGRISSRSKLGMVGSARPRCTSVGRFQAIASCGRIWLYSIR